MASPMNEERPYRIEVGTIIEIKKVRIIEETQSGRRYPVEVPLFKTKINYQGDWELYYAGAHPPEFIETFEEGECGLCGCKSGVDTRCLIGNHYPLPPLNINSFRGWSDSPEKAITAANDRARTDAANLRQAGRHLSTDYYYSSW